MRCGRSCGGGEGLIYFIWALARTPAFSRVVMVSREGLITVPVAAVRCSGRQSTAEVQWRLKALISGCGCSASQLVSGSKPADLLGWGDRGEGLFFAQDASLVGQLARQWKSRMMAQEAALKEVANIKLRRLLAHNKSFRCADVRVGGTVLPYRAANGQSAPRRQDTDATGVLPIPK